MRALSSISSNIYVLQNKNGYLACKHTSPVSILGFKHRKHALYLKKHMMFQEQLLETDTNKRFTILKRNTGTHIQDDINIVCCSIVDTTIKVAVNNAQLVIIDDLVDTKNKITLYKEDTPGVFVDISMIKANMEDLLNH